MQYEDASERVTNPFATRWVRPGAIPYQFAKLGSMEELVSRLREQKWRGYIVGPHGSGKTTLVKTLIPLMERSGRKIIEIALHDGQRRLPRSFFKSGFFDSKVLLVIDGYEQLGRTARLRLAWLCRRFRCGLLVTVHCQHPARGIPLLWRTETSGDRLEDLIARFLPSHYGTIGHGDVVAAFARHRGNIREVFFALYDLFECRREFDARSTAIGL